MPRKKPEELKSKGGPGKAAPAPKTSGTAPAAPAPAPKAAEPAPTMTVAKGSLLDSADLNGDGHISAEEIEMHLEFKRKELEDADAQRDAMRSMTWFALFGMLLYPFTIVATSMLGADKAAAIVGDIAPTYFVAISALVAAFFGADAVRNKKK